jgi:hypothetical protein
LTATLWTFRTTGPPDPTVPSGHDEPHAVPRYESVRPSGRTTPLD